MAACKKSHEAATRDNADVTPNPADLLTIPVVAEAQWSDAESSKKRQQHPGHFPGYVVRWVDQGVGCSKVPDINDIGLMEDRATLRISSQHVANWLHHGVVTEAQVRESFARMAARWTARTLAIRRTKAWWPTRTAPTKPRWNWCSGQQQPSGYTEPLLHARRLKVKAAELATPD